MSFLFEPTRLVYNAHTSFRTTKTKESSAITIVHKMKKTLAFTSKPSLTVFTCSFAATCAYLFTNFNPPKKKKIKKNREIIKNKRTAKKVWMYFSLSPSKLMILRSIPLNRKHEILSYLEWRSIIWWCLFTDYENNWLQNRASPNGMRI